MNILVVEDERLILEDLRRTLETCAPGETIHCFDNAEDALAHAERAPADVAFLDIELGGMSGLELALRLKKLRHETNVVFVTGYADYMGNAFAMHASGYGLKPVDAEHIRRELENLRYPPASPPPEKRIRIRCFGDFEAFVDGDRLKLSRSKARELLAYLVHRNGAGVTKAEIASALWEGRPYTRSLQYQIQRTIGTLERALADAGIGEMLQRRWGILSVDVEQYTSDYTDFLNGDVRALNAFQGEYLSEYSWAEFTTGRLEWLSQKERE